MKKRNICTTLVLGIVPMASVPVANAGTNLSNVVTIDNVYSFAEGQVGTARASADANQMIYCSIIMSSTASPSGICFARDSAGATRGCTTQNASLIQAMGAIGPVSFISFSWNSLNVCTQVIVRQNSANRPMIP